VEEARCGSWGVEEVRWGGWGMEEAQMLTIYVAQLMVMLS